VLNVAYDEDTAKAENELVSGSIRSLLFYFMWKVQALSTAKTNEGVEWGFSVVLLGLRS
jgi:hypothetical protein